VNKESCVEKLTEKIEVEQLPNDTRSDDYTTQKCSQCPRNNTITEDDLVFMR